MKVLVFYSKTGSGHLRAAEAISEQIKKTKRIYQVKLIDCLEQTSLGIKIDPAYFFSILTNKFLPVYNFEYRLTNNFLGTLVLRFFVRLIWGRKYREITTQERPDLIISTHHFISPSIIPCRISCPFIMVVTDLGFPHRIWFDKKAFRTITPTDEMRKYGEKIIGINDRVITLSYPIKDGTGKEQYSAGFKNTLLLVGGGSGAGNIEKQFDVLRGSIKNKKIIVVCGHNRGLFKKLSKIRGKNLEIYGFVDSLLPLIKKSDMVITKAGPATIVEATYLGKPLIITSWIGMQEKDNVDFVVQNHLGIYEPDVKKLPEAVNKVYENYEDYISSEPIFQGGAKKIVEYILREFS